jgi:predicted CxxxxCH...CXXCH cytochrome family protein
MYASVGCDLGVYEHKDVPDPSARLCSAGCHGGTENIAPPTDTHGNTDVAARGVGAHQVHLGSSAWHRAVDCAECHKVPGQVSDEGHLDSTEGAEVIFGALGGAEAMWDGETCSNAYCHGATLSGGAKTTPVWTQVDGSGASCASCHGFPPPAPHPDNPDCGQCHQTVNPGAPSVIVSADEHIDGKLQVIDAAPCDSCHGSNGSSAPPRDIAGNTATSEPGVGAHASHMATSTWHKKVECSACHTVPVGVTDIGHVDTPLPAEVTFSGIAGAARWDGTTCSGSYCHGAGMGGGTAKSPTWTLVDGSQSQCGSCHGAPPPAPHPTSTDCGQCHSSMIPGQGMTIAYPELHIDGKVDVNTDQPCDSCHGSAGNAAPPTAVNGDTATTSRGVGAHRNHLDPSTWHKQIECSECHTVPTATVAVGHIDSDLPAELTFGPLAGAAVWNGTTCTNSYCHGSTLSGGVAPNPVWTSVSGSQSQCDSCHGAPPPAPHPDNPDCGQCHGSMIAGQPTTIAYPDLHIDGKVDVNTDLPCNGCHGTAGDDSGAPPNDTLGNTQTSARGVGAHSIHLAA